MSNNAYAQRRYPFDEDFDPAHARNPEEVLRVDIPGLTVQKSTSVKVIESRPFYVYTRKEADDYLMALRAAYFDRAQQSVQQREGELLYSLCIKLVCFSVGACCRRSR